MFSTTDWLFEYFIWSAKGLNVITLFVDQFCVVQYKNSLPVNCQLITSLTSLLYSSKINPWSVNQAPYPTITSYTCCIVLNSVPYNTLVGILSNLLAVNAEAPPLVGKDGNNW